MDIRQMIEAIALTESVDWDEAKAAFEGGSCGSFALALHEKTGWPGRATENHVWVVNDDGHAVDINGIHPGQDVEFHGDDFLARDYRLSERDRDFNYEWAREIIAAHPERFGISDW